MLLFIQVVQKTVQKSPRSTAAFSAQLKRWILVLKSLDGERRERSQIAQTGPTPAGWTRNQRSPLVPERARSGKQTRHWRQPYFYKQVIAKINSEPSTVRSEPIVIITVREIAIQ